MKTLIGPFSQLLTMSNIPLKGELHEKHLNIIKNAGIIVENDLIFDIGNFNTLKNSKNLIIQSIEDNYVGLPGFIDAHTHICYAGSRVSDFIDRIKGNSYIYIAKKGGGINTTVKATRTSSFEKLKELTKHRANSLLKNGITTAEVKSGYGLNFDSEVKMLRVINSLHNELAIDLIPTCLAAHVKPDDFKGNNTEYLTYITKKLLPFVIKNNLSKRVDIFVEESAFSVNEAKKYLLSAKDMGYKLTIHGDQFTLGGSNLAVELDAVSVDHLEASREQEISKIANSNTSAVVLPGASLGLGMDFAPARKLLDSGVSLVIASDWNPGSAPMGDLLTQACLLATYEKLTPAEIFAGITWRAAHVLNLNDRGKLEKGNKADFIAFKCQDYNEIIYNQGSLKPTYVWKNGKNIK